MPKLKFTHQPQKKKAKNAKNAKPQSAKKMAKRKNPMSNTADDEFIASDSFVGSKPGYIFQNGKKGTGYYLDNSSQSPKSSKKRKTRTKPSKSKKNNIAKSDGNSDDEDVVLSNKHFVSLDDKKAKTTSTVVYLGRIPHGFYEEQVCMFENWFYVTRRFFFFFSLKQTGKPFYI